MQKKKDEGHPLLDAWHLAGRILSAIGTPPLVLIKLLLALSDWLSGLVLAGVRVAGGVFIGIREMAGWLASTVASSIWTRYRELKRKKSRVKVVPKISRRGAPLYSIPARLLARLASSKSFLSTLFIPAGSRWVFTGSRMIMATVRGRALTWRVPEFRRPTWLTLKLDFRKRDLVVFAVSFGIFVLAAVPLSLFVFFTSLPDPRMLAAREVSLTTKIYDRNGTLLYQFYAGENRSLVTLEELPKYVPEATIAIEDQNFYRHPGFDISAIMRAAYANALGNSFQGGSTITQQLVKLALLSPERTVVRKIRELTVSFWTERVYTKDQILAMYLNQVPYGGSAYGVEAAAEVYFGKKAKELTLGEAALLAGLPSAPTAYSPFGSHPEMARERQKQVLAAMMRDHYISAEQAEAAVKEQLRLAPMETSIKAPHFVMYVRDYLTKRYGIRMVERGGLSVVTSLDYPTYDETLKLLDEGVGKQKFLDVGNGAVLVTNPKTGEILSMVGSRDFFDLDHDGNVNVTISPRSPGSSIKPLNYALAFERGLITPATVIDDAPIVYQIPGQPPYAPGNYDGRFHGKVTARVALGASYNVPAVSVLARNGVTNFVEFAQKTGITTFTSPNRFGLSLTLGGGEVLMTDMATAYSSLANYGTRVDLKPVLEVKDYKGETLEDNRDGHGFGQNKKAVLSAQTAFLINNILADDGARAPTFGAGSVLNIPGHTVAVKTGTTETKRDNWTIGYSFGPEPRLVAVWVGNNNNSPMSPFLESGNTGAAAIWHPIMESLLREKPDFPISQPVNIVRVEVCSAGGLLPCANCPAKRWEYFIRGTEPKAACSFSKEEAEKILHPEEKKP